MQIYVACLAAYNNGKLHGEWIDATKGTDHIEEGIKRVLATSPEPFAEEWAIHDYDDFPSHLTRTLGENPNIEDLSAIAEFIEEHGELGKAVLGEFDLDEAKRQIEENFHGEHKNEEDFIYSFYEDCGMMPDTKQNPLMNYIDWQAVARDAFMSDFTSIDSPNGIYVFSNN